MPARPIDGDTKRELVRLLVDTFPTPADLNSLTQFSLDTRLSDITNASTGTPDLALAVVNWCEAQGGDTLPRLVRIACDERPQHADLHTLAARLGFLTVANSLAATLGPQPSAMPRSVGQQQQLFRNIRALDNTYWERLLGAVGVDKATLPGASRDRQTLALISQIEREAGLWFLEEMVREQAADQAASKEAARQAQIAELLRQLSAAEAAEKLDQAIDLGEGILMLDPQHAEARQRTAVAYKRRGVHSVQHARYDTDGRQATDLAVADFTRAIELDFRSADFYWERGKSYTLSENYDQAIADYTQAIELDPNRADFYLDRGWSYDIKQDYDRAIAEKTQAIELEPKRADLYRARGVSYLNKSDHNRAIADFTRAIELAHGEADYYSDRADTYVDQGDYDRAIADYTQAIEAAPLQSSIRNMLSHDWLVTMEIGKIWLARQESKYYNRRGTAYLRKGDREAARRDFQRVVELGGEDAKIAQYQLEAL